MKKYLSTLVMLVCMALGAVAQSTMTDQQLIKFVTEEKEKGSTQSEIVQKLMQRGVDIQQIQRVRRKYERQLQQTGMGGVADAAVSDAQTRMRQNNTRLKEGAAGTSYRVNGGKQQQTRNAKTGKMGYDEEDPDFLQMQAELGGIMPVDSIALLEEMLEQQRTDRKRIFGHDIFNNEALSFEPNMNIATPQDYRLGPGDVVNIDIYGASQESISETISPDGYVTIEGIGPVQLAGYTVAQANAHLRQQVGARYQSSKIQLTVGQTKTILVNVMGEVMAPGTYTLSAFSTVFNALYMAGGITDIGTLRNIKVYRNNREISTVDVYDYILNGKAKGNVRLTDNDVIIVGPYECLVDLVGKVKRPMFYEMKADESLHSLIKYAGGFAGDAYKKSVRVVRKSGAQYSVHTVGEFDMGSFHVADGDSVTVDSIVKRYSNMVEVKGAVFRPGMYELGSQISTVGQLLEAAEGVTEDAIVTRAVMHRMKPNRTLEVVSVDVEGILEGRVADVPLKNEDVLYVASRKEVQDDQTLTIHGEVQYPGIYRYAENETLEDFIVQAGGLNNSASVVKVDVARRIIDNHATSSKDTIAYTYSFALKEGFVIDGEPGFHLMPYDEVYVRKSPGYTEQQNVKVEGEVLFEGTYTLSKKSERLSEVIKKAGGLTKTAYAKGARLVRTRTPEEQMRDENLQKMAMRQKNSEGKDTLDLSKLDIGTTYPVGIELDQALAHPGSDADIVLREGDRIIVPEYTGTVKINGEVMYPNTVNFVEGKGLSYYINQAGGYSQSAKKKQTYIIYMNGNVAQPDRKHKPQPGCEIIVPTKVKGNRMTTTEMLAIGTSTASIATMIATMVNLFK